ncbi:thiolase family protein [Micromonospora sp. NPDC003816]|uniref:thiolase family protein n=1 Tax=Micromonospora sp. NPDC003816 TaxID=3364224 RepID=UPI0036A05478
MTSEDATLVVSAVRTPVGRYGGSLRDVPTVDLGALVVGAAAERAAVAPDEVGSVVLGTCLPGPPMTAARVAAMLAGLPESTLSLTVDRACCSAMTAIGVADAQLRTGLTDLIVAGGMENMSATPHQLPRRWGNRPADVVAEDPLIIRNPVLGAPVARYTGEVGLEFGYGREAQDEWALTSQRRWGAAHEAGRFDAELLPVTRPDGSVVDRDEPPRPAVTPEQLAKLKTVYGSPTVTAGNAPGLNDGAAAVLLATPRTAAERELRPLARILGFASVSGNPRYAAALPADAIELVLKNAGATLADVDLLEVNEAFAATALVTTHKLGETYGMDVAGLRARTNVDGGAVAIGHPVGASGARIVVHLIHEMRRRGGGLAIASICGGVGQADAIYLEVFPPSNKENGNGFPQ